MGAIIDFLPRCDPGARAYVRSRPDVTRWMRCKLNIRCPEDATTLDIAITTYGNTTSEVFARTSEDPTWTLNQPAGRFDFAFRDDADEGDWWFSMCEHDANGTVTKGPLTYKLWLPKETLEWRKQYTFSLFEDPDDDSHHGTMTLTINPDL